MGSRIITLQRQARELGRLRTGTFNGKYPQRSNTWILTSHSRDYIEAAAAEWGGDVEPYQPQGNGASQWRVITEARAIPAILPPGDPLSQSYEVWSRGGCARRCNGEYEQINDRPCFCLAQWGENFHQVTPGRSVDEQPCQMTTRLSVILPDMPDLGSWRLETKSYYSASELAATVDVLKGQLGTAAMVPVALRIEQRTRVAQGKTKQYPVIAMELRGATAGQVMAGQIPTTETAPAAQGPAAVGAPEQAPALPSAPTRDWLAEVAAADSLDALRALYQKASREGAPAEMADAMKRRAAELAEVSSDGRASRPAPVPATAAHEESARSRGPVPSENDGDVDAAWMACVSAAPDGWSTSDLMEAFVARHDGLLADDATAAQLTQFAKGLKGGWVDKVDESKSSTPMLDALKEKAAAKVAATGDEIPF